MVSARDVAEYFLSNDTTGRFTDTTLIQRNGRKFYKGNAVLNKYLHMAQNLYIAKTGEKLFPEDMYAYDNGVVVKDILDKYSVLIRKIAKPELPESVTIFLNKVMTLLENASLEELIELSHEDSEWQNKHEFYNISDQKMDSLAHIQEYKEQYADALYVMEAMI